MLNACVENIQHGEISRSCEVAKTYAKAVVGNLFVC